jgi:hypothetical protein
MKWPKPDMIDTFLILTIFLLPAIIGGSSTRFPASTRTSANAQVRPYRADSGRPPVAAGNP